jgi:YegS/Rv2252/BmrU family lipid kinase
MCTPEPIPSESAPAARSTAGTRIAAVISRASRGGAARLATRLAATLDRRAGLEIVFVASSTEATSAAREAAATAEIVVAVGGDGTVADVATGMLGSRASLAIVPAGSTNITARTLGIPSRPSAAIALLAGPHRVRRIDVGRAGDRAFLHIAGAGFDAELFSTADPQLKRHLGWLAYLPAAAAALRLAPSQVHLTVDGANIDITSALVLVANGGSVIAPSLKMHPAIEVDDGWLDLLAFTATTPAQIAATLSHATLLRLDQSSHVIWRRARRVTIDAAPPLGVQLDGNPYGTTPREFSLLPAGLGVVVPVATATPAPGGTG